MTNTTVPRSSRSRRISRGAVAAILGGVALAAAFAANDRLGVGHAATLRRVESSKVCMVNDRLFPNEQIRVVVDGRTYYGCCEGCKTTLAQSERARTATDPVSRKAVDKATAVIGARPDGHVFYFENEKNLRAFDPKPSEPRRR